jgi:hypothetical protein
MFLIPFVYKKVENIYPIHRFHIFLNKGTLFLDLEESQIDVFCNTNELYFFKKTIINDVCYLEIDTTKTKMEEFYTYYENSENECWRRFILVGNYTEDFLHVNSTNPEFITPILQTILNKIKCEPL